MAFEACDPPPETALAIHFDPLGWHSDSLQEQRAFWREQRRSITSINFAEQILGELDVDPEMRVERRMFAIIAIAKFVQSRLTTDVRRKYVDSQAIDVSPRLLVDSPDSISEPRVHVGPELLEDFTDTLDDDTWHHNPELGLYVKAYKPANPTTRLQDALRADNLVVDFDTLVTCYPYLESRSAENS